MEWEGGDWIGTLTLIFWRNRRISQVSHFTTATETAYDRLAYDLRSDRLGQKCGQGDGPPTCRD